MLQITNISVTERAAEILDRHRVMFRPRDPGDAFALVFMTSFTEPDGATVAGFHPGYMPDSVSPNGLSDMWALARPVGAPQFLFMPKFKWSADEHYVIDIASAPFELLSIGPAGDEDKNRNHTSAK